MFSFNVIVPRPIEGMWAPLASTICMRVLDRGDGRDARWVSHPAARLARFPVNAPRSADEADLNVDLKGSPAAICGDGGHALPGRQSKTRPITQRQPARPRSGDELAGPLGERAIEIANVELDDVEDGACGLERPRPLDELGYGLGKIDARNKGVGDDAGHHLSARLAVEVGKQRGTVEHDVSHARPRVRLPDAAPRATHPPGSRPRAQTLGPAIAPGASQQLASTNASHRP